MVYVIAQPCIGVCDTACVTVCPVDAIHSPLDLEVLAALPPSKRAGLQLFIDPEACICCGACEPECPVEAIFEIDDLPAQWSHFAHRNEAFFLSPDTLSP